SIALARVPAAAATPGGTVQVDVRGKLLDARIVRPPFVRHGRVLGERRGGAAAAHGTTTGVKRMSNVPADLKYARSHEWLRESADGTVEIGISDHAQQALGDLVFVEVPSV